MLPALIVLINFPLFILDFLCKQLEVGPPGLGHDWGEAAPSEKDTVEEGLSFWL